MTNEHIAKWAREAGMKAHEGFTDRQGNHTPAVNALNSTVPIQWLQAFASIVRNATLEEAAKLLDEYNRYQYFASRYIAEEIRSMKS